MYSSRHGRALRGVVGATVATMIALLSHILGGGESPAFLGIALPWLLSLPICVGLTGKKLSFWKLSIAVFASQLLFHVLFVLGAPSGSAMALSPHAGHGGAPIILPPVAEDASTQAELAATPGMWLMHVSAALVTALLIYRGERALLRLREVIRLTVTWFRRRSSKFQVPIARTPQRPNRFLPSIRPFSLLSQSPTLSPLVRRGPPSRYAH